MRHLAADTQWHTASLSIDATNERSLAVASRAGFERVGDLDGNPYWTLSVPPPSSSPNGHAGENRGVAEQAESGGQGVGGRSAWKGAEIQHDRTWRLELHDGHREEVLRALAQVDGMQFTEVTRKSFPLPTLGPILDDVVDELVDGRGFVLIAGTPVEGLGEADVMRMYYGLGQHLGIPVPQNDAGETLVHVRDEGLDMGNPVVRAYQTSARLDYHSDSADVVGLLCIRPAKEGGVSTVVSAAAVFNEAARRRPDLVPVLMEPWWWDRRKPDLATSFFQCRIFGVEADTVTSYYGRSYIESATRGPNVPELTDQQMAALDLVDSIANEPEFVLPMDFRPGDIQFLNNYKVWHARTAYVDHPEPERRRDLYRLWLTVRRELDLPPDFAARGITNRAAAFG